MFRLFKSNPRKAAEAERAKALKAYADAARRRDCRDLHRAEARAIAATTALLRAELNH